MYDVYKRQIASDVPYRYNIKKMPIELPISQVENYISDSVSVQTLVPITEPFGTLQYVGGICVNNKIYCTPNTSDHILVYDIDTDSTYTIGSGLGKNKFKYTGQVLYNGCIYMLHRGMNTMLRVDPKTDSFRYIDLGLKYEINPYMDYRDSYHYNGVISDQGYLYQPFAYNNTDLLKINMETYEVEKIPFSSADTDTWIGATLIPDNKIVFLSGKVWRIWDCSTDTYEDIVHENISCYDMLYDPRYNCLIGASPNYFVAFMLDTKEIIKSDYRNYIATGYGISLGLDGKYYHLEGNRAYYASFDGTSFEADGVNHYIGGIGSFGSDTPYIAGQAIDTFGNIYGIPASGCMSRLSFNGVTTPMPDWMVSSQYLGKY